MTSTEPTPVVFIGRGSPMNALDDNRHTRVRRAIWPPCQVAKKTLTAGNEHKFASRALTKPTFYFDLA